MSIAQQNPGAGAPSCCHQHQQANKPVSKVRRTTKALPSIFMSLLIAFFPKCPICWAIYMSMFGSIGLAKLPYMGWLLPVLIVFLGLHLFLQLKKSSQNGYLPFFISLAGALIIISGRVFFPFEEWILIAGMSLIVSGSLLNSFSTIRISINQINN